ncbi:MULTISPECIES: VOC family protein [Hyphobacterium]|uniref:VOC family protein n=1 Tax=Hyphobacterium vulgare TaxID=1736751 RepID=A0ABV6ZXA5_9PROT
MTERPRFHLAFPVHDLEAARGFYGGILGCPEGREDPGHWIDFDLYGHQIVAHFAPEECGGAVTNDVDSKKIPVKHFGLILDWAEWEALAQRLKGANVPFLVDPYVRFAGKPGEQGTFFVIDPSGNALEFKSFREERMIFEKTLQAH